MFAKITRLRSALISLAFLLAIVAVLNQTITAPVSADGGATSVIVQLRDDPAAVYKAKTVNAGGQVSAAQLQAYRDGLRAKQDQFGDIVERSVPALIAQPGQLRTSLLGMSFLNRLEGWEVRGDRLMMRGKS